jgi:dipeptidyl aminopeptidase/acylaminoacyl peptidase
MMVALTFAAPDAGAQLPPLIPRTVLFATPEKADPKLSPDGRSLAFLAPDGRGVLQIWVRSVAQGDARVVTAEPQRSIQDFHWAYDDHTLLFGRDSQGDERFHINAADMDTRNVRDLTPFQGVGARLVARSPRFRTKILVELNLRARTWMDVYSVDLETGATELDTQNPGDVIEWVADDDLIVRAVRGLRPDGRTQIRARSDPWSEWRIVAEGAPLEVLSPRRISPDGAGIYLFSSIRSQTVRLVQRDFMTRADRPIAADGQIDVDEESFNPSKRIIDAVRFSGQRTRWMALEPSIEDDLAAVGKLCGGCDLISLERNGGDSAWVAGFTSDTGGFRWYLYDRSTHSGALLFAASSQVERLRLAQMKPVTIAARDGLVLNAYLTLPLGLPPSKLPLVLYVHGGPWAKDSWGWDPFVQWLANRGYAVLQVNFRGSTGFGKKLARGGDRQWGQAMQDDLTDSVRWAIAQGIADPARVAIVGGSYGGYAALAGAAFTPDLYRCAVDMEGPANMSTFTSGIGWTWRRSGWNASVGNPDDPRDRKLLERESPLLAADQIRIPMLIAHGSNDPRVNQSESDQVIAALKRYDRVPVQYVVYSDEGHSFSRGENALDLLARIERFLADYLGGRAEPLPGEKVPGSTAVVTFIHQHGK